MPKKIAKDIGIKLYIIETNELYNEASAKTLKTTAITAKRITAKALTDYAHEFAFKADFEGANFTDLNDHRPGFKAVQEAKTFTAHG